MNKRILVLGAGGFVGRHVVRALEDLPWASPVAAGHRSTPPVRTAATLRLDMTHPHAMRDALVDIDAVVNCSRADTTTLAAEAHRAKQHPRVVHLSSMAVYGKVTGTIAEDAPLRADLGAYGLAKVIAERQLQHHGNAVLLRAGCIYGPGSAEWSSRIARWLLERRVGNLGSAGSGYCNLLYIDDLTAAIVAALQLTDGGMAFNLGSANPSSWNAYFAQFAQALGLSSVPTVARRNLLLEAYLLSVPLAGVRRALQRLRPASQRVVSEPITPELLRLWRQPIRLDVHRAQRQLGLTETPLAEGLRRTAHWLQDNDRRFAPVGATLRGGRA